MPQPAFYTPPDDLSTSDKEPYLSAEEVARRLGISTSILTRRIEAGDIPARRVRRENGVGYELLLSDLGMEPDDAPGDEMHPSVPPPPPAGVPYSPVNHSIAPPPAAPSTLPTTAPTTSAATPGAAGVVPPSPAAVGRPPAAALVQPTAAPAATGVARPGRTEVAPEPEPRHEPAEQASPRAPVAPRVPAPAESGSPRATVAADVTVVPRSENGIAEEPPPMSIDPRELVAGLLDRWEHSLEERIHAQQRQRFESDLLQRQSRIGELESRLEAVRAEQAAALADHAAALADRDRSIAHRDRLIADRERELFTLREAAAKKRGRFFNR